MKEYDISIADQLLLEYHLLLEHQEKMKNILLDNIKQEIRELKEENKKLKEENEKYRKRELDIKSKEEHLKQKEETLMREVKYE